MGDRRRGDRQDPAEEVGLPQAEQSNSEIIDGWYDAAPDPGNSDWGLARVKRDWVPDWLWRAFCVGNMATFTPWREILTRRVEG